MVEKIVKPIYLDNATSTEPFPSAIDKISPFFRSKWGSSDAIHQKGEEQSYAIETSLQTIRDQLGIGEHDQYFFTSSGAEAITQLFINHYIDEIKETGHNHFLAPITEDAPILKWIQRLEELSCWGNLLPVDERGILQPDVVAKAINPRTTMLSISWANPLTGVIQPIEEIAKVCQKEGVYLHVDGTSVLGKLPINLNELPIDFFTFEGERIHAPKGTGGLVIKAGHTMKPLLLGRNGINTPLLVALAHSLEMLTYYSDHLSLETARLRDHFERELQKRIPDSMIFFENTLRLPTSTTIGFAGIVAENLAYNLNASHCYCSFGGGTFQRLARVLECCGVEKTWALSAMSFSLSYQTTEEEIEQACALIEREVSSLRKLSKVFR